MNYLNNPKISDLRKLAKQPFGIATFIGAGCSSALKIPLWDDLLIGLNRNFNYYPSDEAVKKDIKLIGYPKVASKIKTNAVDSQYKDIIKSFTQPSACHFTSLHIELVRLSKTILTTNYDESFEETLNALKRLQPPQETEWEFTASSLGNFNYKGIGTNRNIYHIHGSSSKGDIVLTEESYDEQYEQPLSSLQILLTSIFSDYTTVFIGFSFSDDPFVNFLKNALKVIKKEKETAGVDFPQHYCIISDNLKKDYIFKSELTLESTDIESWKSLGIILEDGPYFPGKTVFKFSTEAPQLIRKAGLDINTEQHLITLLNRVDKNKEKLALLSELNIEPIYFEGSEFLQIEHILRELNKPVAAAKDTYTP